MKRQSSRGCRNPGTEGAFLLQSACCALGEGWVQGLEGTHYVTQAPLRALPEHLRPSSRQYSGPAGETAHLRATSGPGITTVTACSVPFLHCAS